MTVPMKSFRANSGGRLVLRSGLGVCRCQPSEGDSRRVRVFRLWFDVLSCLGEQFVSCLCAFRASSEGPSLQRVLVLHADADTSGSLLGNSWFSVVTGEDNNRRIKVMGGGTLMHVCIFSVISLVIFRHHSRSLRRDSALSVSAIQQGPET